MPDPGNAAKGPSAPVREALESWRVPDWFRDAKLGIWSHWGPQAVPMVGDWYARKMYQPGDPHYAWHAENYGHPSVSGYKDIIPLWKAERFDPERLMGLYKKAGARYFVSMGVHHDNFDLWNSKHQRWNAVKMGPHRDIVKAWQVAARSAGLPFGVSEHLGASFTWWQGSHGADTEGPKAGVPYDGANPEFEDLYHVPATPGDKEWYTTDPRWHAHWEQRIADLVDTYHPDLLYTDGGLPFGNETGYAMVARLYADSAKQNGGQTRAVYTCKQDGGGWWVEDMERGVMSGIREHPWQCDTSIGDWYYNRNWTYQPVSWVIHMLADVASKNGNLLLNVVQRPDGSLDAPVEAMLGDLGKWLNTNGEAIYGTRPWTVYGEGPVRAEGGAFKESFAYSASDIRFTTRGGILYAIALGRPEDGVLRIRSLAKTPGSGEIRRVTLPGAHPELKWTRDATALTVNLPAGFPDSPAIVIRVEGDGLTPSPARDDSP